MIEVSLAQVYFVRFGLHCLLNSLCPSKQMFCTEVCHLLLSAVDSSATVHVLRLWKMMPIFYTFLVLETDYKHQKQTSLFYLVCKHSNWSWLAKTYFVVESRLTGM